MRLSFLVSSFLVLGSLGQAAAQPTSSPAVLTTVTTTEGPTTPYAIERDSLWRRAGRVRARTEARIAKFRGSNMALGGTSRTVESYAQLKGKSSAGSLRYTRVKREISKHKTTGAEVEKRFYYGLDNRLLLAEYYEQHQLVRLELHEYPLRAEGEYGTVFRDTQWLRGDYLHLTTHAQENRGKLTHYYYTEEHAPH
jgi:hypothetical protein